MASQITILNVEDDDDDADILARALEHVPGKAYRLHRTSLLADLPSAIATSRPDLILLDLHLPDARGADTIHGALRYAADIPVLVLTGSGNEQIGQASIDAGAQDFIPKAELMTPHLARSIDFAIRRKHLQSDTEKRADHDALTGLLNRSGFLPHLVAAVARVRRQGGGFALAFLDLDGFKAINDRYGHAAGDEVLIAVAKRALETARANDALCRLGGDEFVLLLEGSCTREKARLAARRIAAAIAQPITLSEACGSRRVAVTSSVGLAICPKDAHEADELMALADRAMYDSKKRRQTSLGKEAAARRVTAIARETLYRN